MTLASLAIGANLATPADRIRDLDAELRAFVQEHPVLQSEDDARSAANLVQRAKNTLADLDDERKDQTGPLNEKIKAINHTYAEAVSPIQSGLIVLKGRMTTYAEVEKARREEEAERLRQMAMAADRRATEALLAAQEAEDNAAQGETADVVSASQEAVRAQNDYRKAERDFQRAEREANSSVKLVPGLGARAMSARTKEILSVTDAAAAIGAIGLTEGIAEAILTAARSYKKLKGNYPPGIAVNTTRTV